MIEPSSRNLFAFFDATGTTEELGYFLGGFGQTQIRHRQGTQLFDVEVPHYRDGRFHLPAPDAILVALEDLRIRGVLTSRSMLSEVVFAPERAICTSPVSLEREAENGGTHRFRLSDLSPERPGDMEVSLLVEDEPLDERLQGSASPYSVQEGIRRIDYATTGLAYDSRHKRVEGTTTFMQKEDHVCLGPLEVMRAVWGYALCLMGQETGLRRSDVSSIWMTNFHVSRPEGSVFTGYEVSVMTWDDNGNPARITEERPGKPFLDANYDFSVRDRAAVHDELYAGQVYLRAPLGELPSTRIDALRKRIEQRISPTQ